MIKRLIQLVLDQQAARRLEKEVGRSMKKVARESESTMTKAFRRIGAAVIAAFSVRALVGFTKKMFDLGSSAAETASKFQTVFGSERAAELDTFLGKFTRLAGLTRSAGREMLANFGAVFQGAGLAADASAGLSQRMVQLAGDLQSFHDVPIADAFAAIRSGATGESEPLKRFGIVLRAAEVDARALANTGKTVASSLTEQERVLARTQLIYEKAGVAVGDLARTQNSAANRARALRGRFSDMQETIAVGILPALERLLPLFEELADKAEAFADKTGEAVQALLDLAGIADQEVAVEIASITNQLRGMEDAQKQAFLTRRLQFAAREYEGLRQRIAAAQQAIFDATPEFERAGKTVEDMTNRAIRGMQEEMQQAGEVMNFISRQLADAREAAAGGGGGGGDGLQIPETSRTPPGQEARGLDGGIAPLDPIEPLGMHLQRNRELAEEQLERLRDRAGEVAESMTSAFEGFFTASATGWEGVGGVWASAANAAREAGAAIVSGLVQGRAEAEMAEGTAALAAGLWPPNPAAIASALKHFAAAALFRAIPGVIRGGGPSGGGGGSLGGLPRGAIGTSAPGTREIPGTEFNLFIDPLSPADTRVQRLVLGAHQEAVDRFGPNVKVNIRSRTGG